MAITWDENTPIDVPWLQKIEDAVEGIAEPEYSAAQTVTGTTATLPVETLMGQVKLEAKGKLEIDINNKVKLSDDVSVKVVKDIIELNTFTWEQGGILNDGTETEQDSTYIIRTAEQVSLPLDRGYTFSGLTGYKMAIHAYDVNGVWIHDSYWLNVDSIYNAPVKANYFRFVLKTVTEEDITPSIIDTIKPKAHTLLSSIKLPPVAETLDLVKDTYNQGKFKKFIENKVLLGSLDWKYDTAITGAKRVKAFIENNAKHASSNEEYNNTQHIVKYDKTRLEGKGGIPDSADQGCIFGTTVSDSSVAGYLFLSVGITDSGWGDAYTPTNDEIKAYFNGWQMNVDGTGEPYNGTGTKYWSKIDIDGNRIAGTAVNTNPPTTENEYIPRYQLYYQLAQPETHEGTTPPLTAYPGGTLVVDGELSPAITYQVPTDRGGQVDSILSMIDQLSKVINKEG